MATSPMPSCGRYQTNMVTTLYALVGNSADSPDPILRPSAIIGHDAKIRSLSPTYLGYDTQKFLPPSCKEAMGLLGAGSVSGRVYVAIPVRSSSA
jgi:hypothetical protein